MCELWDGIRGLRRASLKVVLVVQWLAEQKRGSGGSLDFRSNESYVGHAKNGRRWNGDIGQGCLWGDSAAMRGIKRDGHQGTPES